MQLPRRTTLVRRNRNAKIIATLGPATESEESIRALFEAGADVFRLNFSHGEHADHQARMNTIRKIEAEFQRPITVLMDLQGPKLRVGVFADGPVQLEKDELFVLDLDKTPGDNKRCNLPHPEIFKVLREGADLLLDDGKIRLRVESCDEQQATTRVIVGGKLSDRKGVNVPDCVLPISPLTKKDRLDLDFGLSIGADWVALSFVQTPEDVEEALKLVAGRAKVLSKLEKPAAITHLSKIVELSDAVMVARGDLGVELPPEQVPMIQKRIVRNCRMYGKPVVIATQMLESMIEAPTPTRAETTDIATAIYDGADAVMLSAETAAGKFPQEAVSMMNRIIETVEQDPHYQEMVDKAEPIRQTRAADAIAAALSQVAAIMDVGAVATYSDSGATALRAAMERPHARILCFTAYERTARMLGLVWGIHARVCEPINSVESMVETACKLAAEEEFCQSGEAIVITAGMPFGEPGRTNLLRIARIP